MSETPEPDRTSLLEFPCEFPIKAMGKSCDDYETTIVEIVRRHVPDLGEGAVQTRPSKNGNYTSITITVTARDQAQLDAIYIELSAHPMVIMAL